MNKQIGWSVESNLLRDISNQMKRLTEVMGSIPPGGISDAPSDGTPYSRQDGGWVAAGGGASLELDVTQPTHGFSTGDAIRHNGTIYVKAQADSSANAGVIGVVSDVADVDNFTMQYGGILTVGTWTNGTAYFLSPSVAGAIITEPVYNVGEVRQYIGTGTPDGLLVEIDLGDEVTTAGAEYQSYKLLFLIDSSNTSNWQIEYNLASSFYLHKYNTNTGVASSSSFITVTDGTFSNAQPLGYAKSNQTVVDLTVSVQSGLATNWKKISIIKIGWTSPTVTSYKTVLYEGDLSFSLTAPYDQTITIPSTSFAETAISEGDVIYMGVYSDTLSDITACCVDLTTTID